MRIADRFLNQEICTNSANRRFSLCVIVLMLACFIVPVSAITYCWDYAMYRIDNTDHDGMSYGALNAELDNLNYAPAVTFDSSDSDQVQKAMSYLQSGDIIFIGTDHVGYVNSDGSIDHYLQSTSLLKQGKPVSIDDLNNLEPGRLNLDDNLQHMLDVHTHKGLPIQVRRPPMEYDRTNEYVDDTTAHCSPGSAHARCSSPDACVTCDSTCFAPGSHSFSTGDWACSQGKWTWVRRVS